jgi:hypothetical protein
MRRKSIIGLFTALIIPVGMIGIDASVASAAQGDPTHKVTICHATASKTNPYVVITVDVASIGDVSGHGRSGVNADDIIPPFDIAGVHYAGNNWDAAHAPIALSECGLVIPVTPPSDNLPVNF